MVLRDSSSTGSLSSATCASPETRAATASAGEVDRSSRGRRGIRSLQMPAHLPGVTPSTKATTNGPRDVSCEGSTTGTGYPWTRARPDHEARDRGEEAQHLPARDPAG